MARKSRETKSRQLAQTARWSARQPLHVIEHQEPEVRDLPVDGLASRNGTPALDRFRRAVEAGEVPGTAAIEGVPDGRR